MDSQGKADARSSANRITYRSLFWIFILGSIAGFVFEGVFCLIQHGYWESHPATVWGPFCIIYGIGAMAVYAISVFVRGKSLPVRFLLYAFSGAAMEYLCSLFQEAAFGTESWNYSGQFLNIGGRVTLSMALLWGILGIAFDRWVFPPILRLIDRMEGRFWRIVCVAFSVFMAVDLLVSAAALMRWNARVVDNASPSNAVEQLLDDTYGNEAMEKKYPRMRFISTQ